jgi:hypothetical protein
MRIGPVGDECVDAVDHAIGDVRVEVDRSDERRAPDLGADGGVEHAVGIELRGRDHRAMVGEIDRVDASGRSQAGDDPAHAILEEVMLDRTTGFRTRHEDGDRLPCEVQPCQLLDEAGHFERHRRRFLCRLFDDGRPREIAKAPEIGLCRRRREGIAFEMHADQRDPRQHSHAFPPPSAMPRSWAYSPAHSQAPPRIP